MKKIYILFIAFVCSFSLVSCYDDDIKNESIFDTSEPNLSTFDKWLDNNFRVPYNIMFKYKFIDIESDIDYNLIPAEIGKSIQIAKLMKFLWFDTYAEMCGIDFVRTYAPKVIALVGSPAYKTSTNILGTAEGGLKVVLYNINNLNAYNIEALNESYFRTMHHEFAHILHQTKPYDPNYSLLSAGQYIGSSWNNRSAATVAPLGLVSPYAGSEPNEDFVEVIARYLVCDDAWWSNLYAMAGSSGTEIINKKIEMIKEYMREHWGIELDKLRDIVRRRSAEAAYLDLSTNL